MKRFQKTINSDEEIQIEEELELSADTDQINKPKESIKLVD